MRKISLLVILLCSCFVINAQSKIDFHGQRALLKHRLEQRGTMDLEKKIRVETLGEDASAPEGSEENVTALVTLNDGATATDLEDAGAEIRSQRGNIVIVTLPIEQVEQFSEINAVKTVSFGIKVKANLDKAREASGVTSVHEGVDLPQEYTGNGIITGLVDAGVDPNHVTFRDAFGLSSRVKRVWTILTSGGVVTTYDTSSAISGFTTDDKTVTHGTHVAGILAGGAESITNNDYYGVAKKSQIAMAACGSDLYFTNLLLGVEKIIGYAKSEGKPAVVNLSLGTNTGSHDGTDSYSTYLAECGKDAIICVASGNEGDESIVLSKTFTSSDTEMRAFIDGNSTVKSLGYNNYYSGYLEIYGDTDKSYSVTLVLYNIKTNEIVYSMPTVSTASGYMTYVSSPNAGISGALSNDVFTNAFDGYMGAGSEIDMSNNRYYSLVDYELDATTANGGDIVMGVIIDGSAGQRVDAYCDGSYSEYSSYGISGWGNDITPNGTISSMACGDNIISVGCYVSRDRWYDMIGRLWGYVSCNPVGDISSFTSWGKLINGRELPDICAPGQGIISSVSTPYIEYTSTSENDLCAKLTFSGRDNYWDVMAGTSMAAPYMAGVAALWLEADPTLTVDDIREIAKETATKDSYVTEATYPIQWGAGKLNALEGIKKILESTGIENVSTDMENKLLVSAISNTVFEVYVAGESAIKAVLYNMSGIPVVSVASQSNTAVVDASSVAKGVYILSVEGEKSRYSRRVLVK